MSPVEAEAAASSGPAFGTPQASTNDMGIPNRGSNTREYAPTLWAKIVEDVMMYRASDLNFSSGAVNLTISGQTQRYIPSQKTDSEAGISQFLYDGLLDMLLDSDKKLVELHARDRSVTLDFAATLMKMRFRVNLGNARNGRFAVLRPLADTIPTPQSLGLSMDVVEKITAMTKGLFLVVGTTNSGKSTTVASILDYINSLLMYSIITIEDPVEILFENKRCTFIQREVGPDTQSFNMGLRAAMREAPKVIFIGEIRDFETAHAAVEAAETGHVVVGTMHTDRAHGTVSRIVEMAPHGTAGELRALLGRTLQCVIAQALLPRLGGGRVAVREVMFTNNAIRSAIMSGKDAEISNQLLQGRKELMIQFDQDLKDKQGMIDPRIFEMYSAAVGK